MGIHNTDILKNFTTFIFQFYFLFEFQVGVVQAIRI